MKTILGDEIDKKDFTLHFEWMGANMNVLRGNPFTNEQGVKGCQKYCGTVSINGGRGYSMNVRYILGEPILSNTEGELGFSDINRIMGEFYKRFSPKQCLDYALTQIAKEKHITMDEVIKLIAEKKIECIPI